MSQTSKNSKQDNIYFIAGSIFSLTCLSGCAFFLSKYFRKSDKKQDNSRKQAKQKSKLTIFNQESKWNTGVFLWTPEKKCEQVHAPPYQIGQLKVPKDFLPQNTLLQELRYYDSPEYNQARIPHLVIELGLEKIDDIKNPICDKVPDPHFYSKDSYCLHKINLLANRDKDEDIQNKFIKWPRAGLKEHIFFNPKDVKALIVTCGGLCPGMNVVIREIVETLWWNYDVKDIFGAKFGYGGIYKYPLIKLDHDFVKFIHYQGGTILGSSRGGFDDEKIIKVLLDNKINQLYVIGGDGTHRGVQKLQLACRNKKLPIAVCGIPKTIDNDIPIIDQSFGFETGICHAQKAIEAANVESKSHEYGIGIVKLMGRDAGWIALSSSLASRCVNICLIPECQFDLFGEKGLLAYVYERVKERGRLLMVVAEGAELAVRDFKLASAGTDPSGNQLYSDIGVALKNEIQKYCKQRKLDVTIKYIDPSYMIRSVAANAYDSKYSSYVAMNAVHGCMFGYTGFTNGLVNGKNSLISLDEMHSGNYQCRIPNNSRLWRRHIQSSGQPNFINDPVPLKIEEEKV